MRPTYETPGDRAREAAVVEAFARHYGIRTIKSPARYPVDFCVVREESGTEVVTAFGEVKIRTNAIDTYPTFILSVGKWVEGMALAERTATRLLLVVGWDGGSDVRWVDLTALTGPPRIAPGGRRDRNDADDEEPVIHLPTHVFRQIPAPAPDPEPAPEQPETQDNRTQEELLASAKRLAFSGQDFGKLIPRLDPSSSARLKAFVQGLPTEIRVQTIYGRSNPPASASGAPRKPQKRS